MKLEISRLESSSTAQAWYASDMDDGGVTPLARGTFRATITGVGRPGPIEERLGCSIRDHFERDNSQRIGVTGGG